MAIDREKLINKIKDIEGLTMQERNDLVAYLREQKVYGLVWEDKPEDVELRMCIELPILKEVKNRAIISDNPDAPNHILIEGDNLEALTALTFTHEGNVDVIYIDPPYNTGNRDFIYNDSYIDREDGYRHSKWLSFMSKRLRIAKRLLSDRGIIFISIDDNEQAQLKLLCDDIFGGDNFISLFIWEKTQHFGRQRLNTYSNADYVLCYARKLYDGKLKELLVERVKTELQDAPLYNASNNVNTLLFKAGTTRFNMADGIYRQSTSPDYELLDAVTVSQGKNKNDFRLRFRSRWSNATVQQEVLRGTTFWVKTEKFAIRAIYGGDKFSTEAPRQIIFTNNGNPMATKSRLGGRVDTSENATNSLNDILGEQLFSYPKPVSLVGYLLSLVFDEDAMEHSKNATVLDFFAGSGTTLHATMQLNAEDGGKRQCILVTNNENGICENVTYRRNRRVIQGYTTPKGAHVAGLTDNSLRYYRTAFVGRHRTPTNMRRLMLMSSDMLCIKENIYTEHDEFGGMDTIQNGFRYFADDGRQMLVIYDERAIYKVVDSLIDMQVANPIITYVFSPANDPWHSEFANVEDKVRLTALPAAIYNAYKRVLPKPPCVEAVGT